MKPTHFFESDINHDLDFSELMDNLHAYDLQLHIIQPLGPAGGNPLVHFLGPKENLEAFKKEFHFESEFHTIYEINQ